MCLLQLRLERITVTGIVNVDTKGRCRTVASSLIGKHQAISPSPCPADSKRRNHT